MMKTPGFKPSSPRRLAMLGGLCAGVCVLLFGGLSIAQQAGGAPTEPDAVGGPAMARRLTESQYRATVADIFGADVPIVGRFERPLREDDLIAIGTGQSGFSPFSFEQYDASARGVAENVLSEERRAETVPCRVRSATRFDRGCAARFVEQYGERLFRRPLTRAERDLYVQTARATHERLGDFYKGLEYALAGMMVSPEFLLRVERAEPVSGSPGRFELDDYSMATRLSYFLTNSTPDAELLRAAETGELKTDEGLARQVDRLIATPRFEGAVRAFFADMLEFEKFDDTAKDPVIYPAYNSVVAADAQEQTLRTIVGHLITRQGDYRELFTTRRTHLTRALGAVYRMPVATRNGWESAEYPANSGRTGILTDISFLALHSHPGRSSATLRGVSVRKVFMCQHVPDPPPDVDFSVVQDPSNTAMPTARDRLTAHQIAPACVSCHRLTDPIGLTLEQFDGVGSFRTRENEAVIDVSGSLDGRDFQSAQGLGQALAAHPQVPRCLVDKMYSSAVGRSTLREERPYLNYLNQTFVANGYRVPALMRAIALSKTFYAVSAQSGEEGASERAAIQSGNGDRS